MALSILKCTECGHDVSSFAEKCPNCGCPVSVMLKTQASSESKKYDVVLESYASTPEERAMLMRFIKESSGGALSLTDAQNMLRNLPQAVIVGVDRETADDVVSKIRELNCSAVVKEHVNTQKQTPIQSVKSSHLFTKDGPVKCPRCGSTAVTTTSRGYSLIWGFAGSNKTVNRCGKCGHTWKP